MVQKLPLVLIALGVACLLIGSYFGLFVAPPEHYMGEVQRIMYVHVPTAWNALLAMTFAFGCAVVFLFTSDWTWDARMEGAIEVGQGNVHGHPGNGQPLAHRLVLRPLRHGSVLPEPR